MYVAVVHEAALVFQIRDHDCFILRLQHLHLDFIPPNERKYCLYLQFNTREATHLLWAIWISFFSPGSNDCSSSVHPNAVGLVSTAG